MLLQERLRVESHLDHIVSIPRAGFLSARNLDSSSSSFLPSSLPPSFSPPCLLPSLPLSFLFFFSWLWEEFSLILLSTCCFKLRWTHSLTKDLGHDAFLSQDLPSEWQHCWSDFRGTAERLLTHDNSQLRLVILQVFTIIGDISLVKKLWISWKLSYKCRCFSWGMTLMHLQVLIPVSECIHSLARTKVMRKPCLKIMNCSIH